MKNKPPRFVLPAVCVLYGTFPAHGAEPPPAPIHFEKLVLDTRYFAEGANICDMDADGNPDITAGPLWWKGPDFKEAVHFLPVHDPFKIPGYSNFFFSFPEKLDDDPRADLMIIGLPGTPVFAYLNPAAVAGAEPPAPTSLTLHEHACNESPEYRNLTGDAHREVVMMDGDRLGFLQKSNGAEWSWKSVSEAMGGGRFHKYVHGLGVGDVNGDGREDILERQGWWEQPGSWDGTTPWTFHAVPFAPGRGGSQMFAYDVDGDGDRDVITAIDAHGWGLAWHEQVLEGGVRTFIRHDIMTDKPEGNPYGVCFSQLHALELADLDGDGLRDIITGKCYFAHNGNDPGAKDPAVLYWFRLVREEGKAEFIPYLIDSDSGLGRQIGLGDINGDGKLDIVTSNKKGTFLFRQTK